MVLLGETFGRGLDRTSETLMNGVCTLAKEAPERSLAHLLCKDTMKSLSL